MQLTPADVLKALSALRDLIEGIARIYNKYNLEPSVNSLAFQELQTGPYNVEVNDSHARGLLAIESASDHLMVVFGRIADKERTPSGRGILSCSAVCCLGL